MSEKERIQNLLAALDGRMRRGELSQDLYERLKSKWTSRLESFEDLMTVTCANCGGIIRARKERKRVTCPSCGFVNKVIKEEKPKGPEEQIIDELSSIQEAVLDYKGYRHRVGPEAMQGLKQRLALVRFKISSGGPASAGHLMERAEAIEQNLEVLERYYKDYEMLEGLGVNPDSSLNVTFKAILPPKTNNKEILEYLEREAKKLGRGEAERTDLEEALGGQPISWTLTERETGFYVRNISVLEETVLTQDPSLSFLQDLRRRETLGMKLEKKEKNILDLYKNWKTRAIDAFRKSELYVKLPPQRELLLSLDEEYERKWLVKKRLKQAAVNVWKLARLIWVPHWKLTYSSVLGQHSIFWGPFHGATEDAEGWEYYLDINTPTSTISLGKGEILAPRGEGEEDVQEWLEDRRRELIALSRELTEYERKFRLRRKEEEYWHYAEPVVNFFRDLGLQVEFVTSFMKMGLKMEGKWLEKGDYEKIAASLEPVNLDYVYLPAWLVMFECKTTHNFWYYYVDLYGETTVIHPNHPIVNTVLKARA